MVDPSDYGDSGSGSDDSTLPTSDIEPSNPRSTNTGTRRTWTTKLDFSVPYVVVAEDKPGDIVVSKGDLAIMTDSDDWRRLDDNPNREIHVVATWASEARWLNFCDLAQDQFNEDPNELLESDIERLVEVKENVYWPPGSKPDAARTCQVCESRSDDDDTTVVEIDLHDTRKVPVCASHSVKELAKHGFLS